MYPLARRTGTQTHRSLLFLQAHGCSQYSARTLSNRHRYMQVIRETVNAPGCVTSVFHPSPPPNGSPPPPPVVWCGCGLLPSPVVWCGVVVGCFPPPCGVVWFGCGLWWFPPLPPLWCGVGWVVPPCTFGSAWGVCKPMLMMILRMMMMTIIMIIIITIILVFLWLVVGYLLPTCLLTIIALLTVGARSL